MITWINCSERMPPDDMRIICVVDGCPPQDGFGCFLSNVAKFVPLHHSWKWTPYTEEAWSELTR